MIAKHTPGPWSVEKRDDHYRIASADPTLTVGRTYGDSYGEFIDANLMAAAPELLAAIVYSDDAHWTPAMRAAIAKARIVP